MKNKYSQALVNQITDECCEVIEDMMLELHVPFTRSNRRLFGACPVHGGDNPAAWNLYPEGDNVRGIWFCRSRNCHKKWKKTLVGFVHAILSNRSSEPISWTIAVDWMAKFLGYKKLSDVVLPDRATLERQQFSNATRRLNLKPRTNLDKALSPDKYRKAVEIPSQYYVERNYNVETLTRYDIGYAKRTNRSVVPIYDSEHKYIVGMTARSHWDKCSECGYYHNPQYSCPKLISEQINACKWKNSPGFEAAHHLYNLWFARQHIMDSSTIILVEGPGDVWRLEEAGIKNSVAIFGTDLCEEQLSLIESSWAMNVIVLTDSDEAGRLAATNIKEKLSRTHRLYFPTITTNDVGALQTDQVTDDIAPILDSILQFQKQVGVT